MRISATLAMLAAVLTAGPAPAKTVSLPASDDPVDFAWTLYRKAAALNPDENALVSPYSAREAVGLAYIGARGETADGLAKALRAGAPADFVKSVRNTRHEIEGADPKATIEVANSLWLRSKWMFLDSYVSRAKNGFDAQVFRRDFAPEAAAKTIADADAWVSRRTHGKITKAVDSLEPTDVAVLLNAIYFKGVWKRPFDKKKTTMQDFHLAFGEIVQRPRMSFGLDAASGEADEFAYTENADMQAVRLPYGSGRFVMTLVLPAKGTTLTSVIDKLTGTWWRALCSRLESRRGQVEIPPFKIESSTRLNGPLIEMGAATAFDRLHGDFRDMAVALKPTDMLYISEVQQRALIEVDEEGTVAAAKSSVNMARGSAMRQEPPPFVFIADRPFLFAIEDSVTGTLLFVGSVQDPH